MPASLLPKNVLDSDKYLIVKNVLTGEEDGGCRGRGRTVKGENAGAGCASANEASVQKSALSRQMEREDCTALRVSRHIHTRESFSPSHRTLSPKAEKREEPINFSIPCLPFLSV